MWGDCGGGALGEQEWSRGELTPRRPVLGIVKHINAGSFRIAQANFCIYKPAPQANLFWGWGPKNVISLRDPSNGGG